MRITSPRRTMERPVRVFSRLLLAFCLSWAAALGSAGSAHAQLKAASVEAAAVTLSWTAPGDDGNTGTAAAYDLRYSQSTITSVNWDNPSVVIPLSGEPAPQIAGTVQYYTAANLQPSTTYYFAIRAGDEAGNWSGLSNVVNVTTGPENTPPAAVADLRILTRSETSITLGWTAPGDDGSTGTASQYVIKYSTSPITNLNFASAASVANPPAPAAAGAAQTVTVAGLQPGVTYYFAMKTADEVPNWSGLSNVVSGSPTGDVTAPSAIADLKAD